MSPAWRYILVKGGRAIVTAACGIAAGYLAVNEGSIEDPTVRGVMVGVLFILSIDFYRRWERTTEDE